VTVDGVGSRWNNRYLYVGRLGDGTLRIINGATLESDRGYIGGYDGFVPSGTEFGKGAVTVGGVGSTWTNGGELYVGYRGDGTLSITGGAMANNVWNGYIGNVDGTGIVTVQGVGSYWNNDGTLYVGYSGEGTLNITDGAIVRNRSGYLGYEYVSGTVNVQGEGSCLINNGSLYMGRYGTGLLNIFDGGLVAVGGTLTMSKFSFSDGFINMDSGGKLALYGKADDSLSQFMSLIEGGSYDTIRYWSEAIIIDAGRGGPGWASILYAPYDGVDYTLEYLTEGDLAGYTVLTVGVPEPATMSLLMIGALCGLRRKKTPATRYDE
jgi:T5SS/PEP-CTERM-associated repeat protein